MQCKNYFSPDFRPIHPSPPCAGRRVAFLLLHCLFHADGVGHELQVTQNFWLFSLDVAFDRRIGQQLGQVAFGAFEASMVRGEGKVRKVDLTNMRARLMRPTVIDEGG